MEILINEIQVSENPRTKFDEDELQGLANSIINEGLIPKEMKN